MTDRDAILRFIARFKGSEDVFLNGCCFWFAHILEARFMASCMTTIMYEPVEGHFMARIDNRYYDIRGDVSEMYRGKPMYDMHDLAVDDSSMYRHLMRDCRDFEEVEDDD